MEEKGGEVGRKGFSLSLETRRADLAPIDLPSLLQHLPSAPLSRQFTRCTKFLSAELVSVLLPLSAQALSQRAMLTWTLRFLTPSLLLSTKKITHTNLKISSPLFLFSPSFSPFSSKFQPPFELSSPSLIIFFRIEFWRAKSRLHLLPPSLPFSSPSTIFNPTLLSFPTHPSLHTLHQNGFH